jgi:hypothetical protein
MARSSISQGSWTSTGTATARQKKMNARPASPFNAYRRTTLNLYPRSSHARADLNFAKKRTHTVVPIAPVTAGSVWTAAGFACGRWLIDLGSAVKPLAESENQTSSRLGIPEALVSEHKKPTSGVEVGAYGYESILVVTLHHFPCVSHSPVDYHRAVHYALSSAPQRRSHTTRDPP